MSPTRMASEHRWIYIGAIVLLVAMLVVGLLTYTQQHATNESYRKAQQLSDELVAAGYRAVPDQDQIAKTLGTGGGAVCENPAGALQNALWKVNLANGAAGPGQRPVVADARTVEAEAIVLNVYCPDKLEDFRHKLDDLDTAKTVNT
ncbi:hypothetical protein [Kitasatospora sp. DSM 101779]|uniref:hypothetical protein n=1 Tax=Kitasatospora sp. DSM 101779 TaxID=2853165 RepID=UPI0021D831FC|nr:hypothetical protein [Kitasatospora sp. DSM 101779]MCU7826271.1 hypothetical protein [Kitasatospora sp. DSM 101779]